MCVKVLRNTTQTLLLVLPWQQVCFSNSKLTLVIKHNKRLARDPFGWFYVDVNDFHAITNKKQCFQCLQELSACDALWSFSTFRSCWAVLAHQSTQTCFFTLCNPYWGISTSPLNPQRHHVRLFVIFICQLLIIDLIGPAWHRTFMCFISVFEGISGFPSHPQKLIMKPSSA